MIAQFLYKNPRILLLLIGVIAIAGFCSFALMPRLEDPVLGKRVGVISTVYPGADAQRVETLVTLPFEEQLQGIGQIKQVRSNSRAGISNIVIKLRDDIDQVELVWSDVRDKIADVESSLPEGCLRPSFDVFPLKAFAAIVAIKWHDPKQTDFGILRKLAAQLRSQIATLPGTESVQEYGDPGEFYLAEVEPTILSALQLSTASIAGQIAAKNQTHPAGFARGEQNQMPLDVQQTDTNLEHLKTAVIRYGAKGDAVKLSDIARLTKAPMTPLTDVALVDGERAIVLGAYFDDQLRVERWSAAVANVVENFQRAYASEIRVETIFSQQQYIDARLNNLLANLCLGGAAVVLVVLVLMGWRSMIVVGVTLPLCSFMVLSGMRVLEIPMHQMSITGLIIALGLLIDNAIVIVEDVRARIFDGDSTLVAIRRGIRHLAMPLFGSTLTTALAFTPIATLPGPPGEFVGTIAISVILAISASFLLAMTVVPALLGMMSSDTTRRNVLSDGLRLGFMRKLYAGTLQAALRVPPLGVLLGCVLPAIGFVVARDLPEQFFPPSDRNQLQIEVELPARESVDRTLATVRTLHKKVVANPAIERAHWSVGRSAPTFYYNVVPSRRGTPFYAQAIVDLADTSDVTRLVRSLQQELSEHLAECRIVVRQLEQGPPFDAPIEVRVVGPDLAKLQALGSQLRLLLSHTSHVIHTRSDLEETIPKIVLDVDAEESSRAGQNIAGLSRLLYTTLEGAPAGKLLDGEEALPVTVRMASRGGKQLDRLAALELAGSPRRPALGRPDGPPKPTINPPLAAIADFQLGSDVAAIVRINGERTNEIKAYLNAGVLPSTVLAEFQQRLATADFRLPPGYRIDFGGEGAERSSAVQRLVANATLLFTLMILTLVVSFRSFRCAAVIVSVGGLAIGLGPLSLWLFGYPFGFMAIVGTMGLVGVAINDSIVVLAAIRGDEAARSGDINAVTDVVVSCTRHIITTTLTTIVGFTPLILSGGGFWPPLAITIACGVGGATFLALYFVPSLHLLLHIGQVKSATNY